MDASAPATVFGVVDGTAAVRAGRLAPPDWVEACLARVKARDGLVHAWAHIDGDRARSAARNIAARPAAALPLVGLPVGVKDVIDVAGMPTVCNSPIEAGHVARVNAAAVARLEAAGAIVLGKTVTTEYAFTEPGPTVNPLDRARTPGGSSSGSAAAVADLHVPAALTTQTGGSTIRPAAFCGIVGYKPPFGRVPTAGLRFLAPSLDVIGVHARSVADTAALAAVLEGRPRPAQAQERPRFAFLRPPQWELAEPAAAAMLEAAAAGLRAAGAEVRWLALPPVFDRLDAAHRVVMSVEVARCFADIWKRHSAKLSAGLRDFIALGRAVRPDALAEAQSVVAECKATLFAPAAAGEVIASPAAPGEAPLGLGATGSSVFNRPWSLLQIGALTLPFGCGPAGLPLGFQIADPGPACDCLFPAAGFAEHALAPHRHDSFGRSA